MSASANNPSEPPRIYANTSAGPDAFEPLPSTQNRALDPSKRNLLADSVPYFKHHWDGERKNNWYLELCGVHPDYAGKRLGRELVSWGLDRAKEEGVHASVAASKGSERFYLRSGFEEIVGNCNEGQGNPLKEAGVEGGDILFMFPKLKQKDEGA
jgi:GNAT superfamily N-acetyltransferase